MTNPALGYKVQLVTCPHCGNPISPASMLGRIRTTKKSKAARENGKKGGRPSRVQKPLAH